MDNNNEVKLTLEKDLNSGNIKTQHSLQNTKTVVHLQNHFAPFVQTPSWVVENSPLK